jgi:hypothetical protein
MKIWFVIGAMLALGACQTTHGPSEHHGSGVASADNSGMNGTILSDGVLVSFRHVQNEPTTYIPGSTATAPALRITGVDGADGVRAANRAMGLICGIDLEQAETYGAYGDPLKFDAAAGEWIYWLDCRKP